MLNKSFGAFLKRLREKKEVINENGDFEKMTQKHLGDLSDMSARQISKIENGQGLNAQPYIDSMNRLASAFNLSEREKQQFFARGGLSYSIDNEDIDTGEISDIFRQLNFPASARTRLWDFIAFNSYHAVFHGYTQDSIAKLNDNSTLGANLLRVTFDPYFRETHLSRKNYDPEAVVRAFRESSFKHVDSKRHEDIIREMRKYPNFNRIWRSFELSLVTEKPNQFRLPINRIEHSEFGTLEFLSLRVPARHVGFDIEVIVYAPLFTCLDNYQKLMDKVKLNTVYEFDQKSQN